MTILTGGQLLTLMWNRSNGKANLTQLSSGLAIVLAESGLNTTAISDSGDYGTWQINEVHFGDGIINRSNWRDQQVQINEAYRLSAGFTNWAAWCTAWIDPGPNCGHGWLPVPQPGSPADDNLDQANADLARWQHTPLNAGDAGAGPAPDVGNETVTNAWREIVGYAQQGAPNQLAQLRGLIRATGRIAA